MPRAGLSAERVVQEAEVLADEVGFGQVTLAALAERFGVRQPSLYKHVDGIDAVRHAISVRAKRELADVLGRAAVGRSGQDAVIAIASAYRAWALKHPGRYAATVRAPLVGDAEDEAASLAAVGVVTDVLDGYGLSGEDAIDATRALRSALHGFLALEAASGFGLPVDIDRSFQRMVLAVAGGLAGFSSAPA
jgi:AcrR family transcriptional regulator